MPRAFSIGLFLALIGLAGPAAAETLYGTLYKNAECTCCEGHADYLRQNDIILDIKTVEDLEQMSKAAGIPSELQGCHAIFLQGYVIEGHVTNDIIRKLLKERPTDVVGITLPGMPTGVPGMPGSKTRQLDVLAVKKDGTTTVFATQ